jgi:two-component system, OmpR family, sensor histidine kinase VicK
MDKGRVNQVLDNLIGNAIKFSPDGGVITVRMEDYQDEVVVSVADEGIGLPLDKIERIFDRFYQIDGSSRRRFGGTGLGLAIVKRIVEAHNGRIWVESEVNAGSVFIFALPK